MKKFFSFAILSAVALAGAMTFNACSSDDIEAKANTSIKKEDIGKSSATQFALNIGRTSNVTRSTAIITQRAGNNFRGMDNIYLIPMSFRQAETTDALGAGANAYAGPSQTFNNSVVWGASWKTIVYNLGDITNSEISGIKSSKVYSLTLPVGTDNFLFYGKAPRENLTTPVLDSDKDALNGKLSISLSTNVAKASDITAALGQISSAYSAPETTLLVILNDITAVTGWSTLDNTDPNNATLIAAYKSLTTVGGSELRNGSAEGIRATVQELYRTVLAQERVGQTTTVHDMANAIRTKIEESFDVFFDEIASDNNVYDTQVASTNINDKTGNAYNHAYYNAYLKYKSTEASVCNFPVYQGLPSGAARLKCTSGTFSYENTTNIVGTGETAGISNIMFPAELVYFANSGLRATPNNKEVSDYPITVTTWDQSTNWGDWTQTAVAATTRAVAMKDNVNYGVAMLESSIHLGDAAISNSLDDNREAIIHDGITGDQTVSINDHSFILTGVLVGGQPSVVDWEFLPASTATMDRVIYDRILDNGTKAAATDYFQSPVYPDEAYDKDASRSYYYVPWSNGTLIPNYTLVLDNYLASGTQGTVNVALELINNTGVDFYGANNVIPAGGTFYLVGQLNPANPKSGSTIDWDSYTATGNNDYATRFPAYGKTRVFAQDHTTVARFSFSASALKSAYSTVPDLRSIQMLFGLSVDLEWKQGLTFEPTL